MHYTLCYRKDDKIFWFTEFGFETLEEMHEQESSLQAICWRGIEFHELDHHLPKMMVIIAKRKYSESEFVYYT